MKGGTLALLESGAQALASLARSPRPEAFVALSPSAAAALEQAGVRCHSPEDFYDEKALCSRGDAVLDAQIAWADWIDLWIRDRRPDLDEGFRPARWHLFHLKRLFDSLLYRAQALEALRTAFGPERVLHFPTPASLNAQCVPLWAARHGIGVEALPAQGDERFAPPPWRRRVPSLAQAASRLKREALLRAPGRGTKVLVRPEYDVAELLSPLRRAGLRPVAWKGFVGALPGTHAPLGAEPPAPLSEVCALERWFEMCRPLGLDFSPVAAPLLAEWWQRTLPLAWGTYAHARKELRRRKIGAVLVPIADTPEETAVVRAARREGIPVTLYQHGGFAGACEHPAWEITDLDQADEMFFYGEGAAGFYKARLSRYKTPKAAPVPVGSARLEALALRSRRGIAGLRSRLRRGLAAPDKLVLYFPTMHAAYSRYLCYGELPDVRHWKLQRDIVRLFPRGGGARVVYRPFEGFFASPVPDLLGREGLEAVVERGETLADLAEACDAVVCDIPSTGLLEALLARRPTFVYADGGSVILTPEAERLLARRAFVSREASDFVAGLRRWLGGAPFPGDLEDRAFLKGYGTGADDGRAAQRAVAALRVVQ